MKIQIHNISSKKSQFHGITQLPIVTTLQVQHERHAQPVRALQVRPYTTRKGDSVEIVAEKRGFLVDDLRKLNHSINVDALEEGDTILLPSEKLSIRDKEIIGGMGQGYRTYPVRKGESIEDIITKRNISMVEMVKLNPDVNLMKLKKNMILKLPAGKYTIRETEMLMGVVKVPTEYFQQKGTLLSTTIIGEITP